MKKIIRISKTLTTPTSPCPVRAIAEAFFDEETGELETTLKTCSVGSNESTAKELNSEIVRSKVDRDEAIPAAKEIFHSWTKRFLQTQPVPVEK